MPRKSVTLMSAAVLTSGTETPLRHALRVLCVVQLFVVVALGADYGKVTAHKVAEGVYLFTTTPYADVGFCGNVTAIVGDRSVLVFDSGATPRTAEAIIAELRRV